MASNTTALPFAPPVAAHTSSHATSFVPPPSNVDLPVSAMESARRLWHWPTPQAQVDVSAIINRITSLGAQRTSRFTTLVEYATVQSKTKAATAPATASAGGGAVSGLHRVTMSAHPQRTFVISSNTAIDGGAPFSAWIDNTATLSAKQTTEFDGAEYRLADWIVRVATVKVSQRPFPSAFLEISHIAVVVVSQTTFNMIGEFASAILADMPFAATALTSYRPRTSHTASWPLFNEFGLGRVFTPRHTAVLYVFASLATKQFTAQTAANQTRAVSVPDDAT